MIPFLTYPLALAALATLPALAAIYLLRNRFRRKQVSSLVLWRFHVQSKSGGTKIHKLQLPFLFFLELLILLLLVTAATGPYWKAPQSSRPLVVILDDSFSMRAIDGRLSARDRAYSFLKNLYRQPPPYARLILAGTSPHLLGSSTRNWREVDTLLSQWNCLAPDAAIGAAIAMAASSAGTQANILVLTDHPPADEKVSNPRLEWHAFGTPLDNFAIVNASRTAFGDQDRCLLEIANFSSQARATRLSLQTGTNLETSSLSLGARASQRLVFNLPSSVGQLRAMLEPDALAADNEVLLLPPVRKKVRVQVALTNEDLSALADRTLKATGLRSPFSEDPEVVIHETDAPVGSNSWNLVWSTLAATNAFTGPFIIDDSHPLAEGVALNGTVWAGAQMTNAPGEIPVILAGNVPLLSAREDSIGRQHLLLNFDPQLSTLPDTPDWPILFWNILKWRIEEAPGLKESNVRLGAETELKTTGEAVTVAQPDGTRIFYPTTGGDLALETPEPGIYSVVMGAVTNQFAVNTLNSDGSDLSACASGQFGKWSEDTEHRLEQVSAVWLFGLLALATLAGHSYLVATSKGK
ncbi:MAG: BatA domain-containing protein [Limisphaerales bacterium]